MLICILLGRPILFYGSSVPHPDVEDTPSHELALVAAQDIDNDDAIDDALTGDPLVAEHVVLLPAPELRCAALPAPPLSIPPQRGDRTDHPPRLA